MYTAMAVVALTLSLTSGKVSPAPAWLDDYQVAKGRQLSDALRVRQGVVISDKTGRSQAFRASGTVSRTDFASALARYAGQPEVTQTEFQTTTTTAVPQTTVQ